MTLLNWIVQFGTSHEYLIYGATIILACAEGPILSIIFGILIRLGYFHFWLVYAALMIGDLLGDVIWYYIGYYFGHRFIGRFGKYFSITEENVGKVTRIFHKYKHSILFISKLTSGLGFAVVTLMTAGMVRIPFWRYISINFLGQFFWTAFLLGIGYSFGHLYVTINSIFGKITVAALFVVILFALHGYRKYLKDRADKMEI